MFSKLGIQFIAHDYAPVIGRLQQCAQTEQRAQCEQTTDQ
jgi:hypothetical protein